MNLSFFTSFIKKTKTKTLKLPESLLMKELKFVADENNLHIFENITIYHHAQNFFIPFLILDEKRGIFLFEYKDWSYDELKNANIEKATGQDSSKDTLAFEKSHQFIKRKFNELTHTDGVPIFNYLLMENLNTDQYKHLDSSFQELLPQDKVIFNDSSKKSILDKLMQSEISTQKLPDKSNIMATLLIQYGVLSTSKNIYLATKEQINFIDSEIKQEFTLVGPNGSGKTSSILLKVILEKLKKPALKIIIIKPSTLACDILKRKLLEIIEHAIIEIDITSIDIFAPEDFTNKSIKNVDLIICDDSEFYSEEFLISLKNKANLIVVKNLNSLDDKPIFTKNFSNKKRKIVFHKTNPHAKALHIISSLLTTNNAKDILIVSSNLSREKLIDDLNFFIKDKAILLDSSKNLIDQDLNNLSLSSYKDTNSIEVKFIILMDICSTDINKLKYAYNLAKENVYILYEDECENLELIRSDFENSKK